MQPSTFVCLLDTLTFVQARTRKHPKAPKIFIQLQKNSPPFLPLLSGSFPNLRHPSALRRFQCTLHLFSSPLLSVSEASVSSNIALFYLPNFTPQLAPGFRPAFAPNYGGELRTRSRTHPSLTLPSLGRAEERNESSHYQLNLLASSSESVLPCLHTPHR